MEELECVKRERCEEQKLFVCS